MNNYRSYRTVLAGAGAAVAVVLAAGPAAAHVTVSAPDAARGGSAVLMFRVPNESATGSPTTQLSIQFPALTEVDTQTMPGWKADITRDAEHKVTAVTWTADAGGGIGPGQFAQFAVLADDLPDTDTLTLPAVQTYADGQVVHWDQKQTGDNEPENPAPTVKLAPKQAEGTSKHGNVQPAAASSTSSEDKTARWLGGIGIVLGALGLLGGVGLGAMRRKA
ncbi:YcnI family copper-binding membrane protein [Nocardia stercoris]|uniref:DUF1775 domain-containing protein n=1 Tax=Nocardia stercoris TaxID=2483361 RepID=A0A3M2KYL7_9NOCA|nr:YcnI family protein [Nocardia stercoris]RMI29716.1 DUF1775 domain-containing protein [Nocardia stercoris]